MHNAGTVSPTAFSFSEPVWIDRVSSTNSLLRDKLHEGTDFGSGFVLAAREQTAGRGRFDRPWIAPAGRNLTFSFLLHCPSDHPAPATLAMALALGVVDALTAMKVPAHVKWPNDVLAHERKICGLLCERQTFPGSAGSGLIAGVGLNLNMTAEEAAVIDRPATSLLIESGHEIDIVVALKRVLECCEPWVCRWIESGFAGLREQWLRNCLYLNTQIAIMDCGATRRGLLRGFGEQGEALLEDSEGDLRRVWSGDVSVPATDVKAQMGPVWS